MLASGTFAIFGIPGTEMDYQALALPIISVFYAVALLTGSEQLSAAASGWGEASVSDIQLAAGVSSLVAM